MNVKKKEEEKAEAIQRTIEKNEEEKEEATKKNEDDNESLTVQLAMMLKEIPTLKEANRWIQTSHINTECHPRHYRKWFCHDIM